MNQNNYIIDAYKLLKTTLDLINEEKGWELVITKEKTNLYKKNYQPEICSIPIYMVKTIINKPKNELINKIWRVNSKKLAKKNDFKLLDWKLIEYGTDWKVISQYNEAIWPIFPRHLVYYQVKIDICDRTYLVAQSINHPLAPTDETNYVRAHVYMSIYEYVKINENKTGVLRIAQINPNGYIPEFIINLFAKNQVDLFNNWKNE